MSDRPMDPYFRDALEGLRAAAQHLMAASAEIQAGGQALVRTADAVLHAKNEHEDLRESVARLERLVIEQGAELRRLHERLNGGTP